MRCSSCEPLLDAYLEAVLRPRQSLEVAEHLRGCNDCQELFGELRVIDALLTTARAPASVARDFTATVLSAAPAARPRSPRRIPLLAPLLLYLAVAWALAAVAALRANDLLAFAGAAAVLAERNLAALGAAARAFAPATPLAAAAVTIVLSLDLLLLCALFYGYRRLRPMIALYLARGSRS